MLDLLHPFVMDTKSNPADDILAWAVKLKPWQQDALRRLATKGTLDNADRAELLQLLKNEAGFALDPPANKPFPIDKSHIALKTPLEPTQIKAIRNIENVNKLSTSARLEFKLGGLTVIYGKNGSGETGYIRILRKICRTRIDNQSDLNILSNVYGSYIGEKSAHILLEIPLGEEQITWRDDAPPSALLAGTAVFDNKSAALYVDSGYQLRYLPFRLDLPYLLNDLCLSFNNLLKAERDAQFNNQFSLTEPSSFSGGAVPTAAHTFFNKISAKTTDDEIATETSFTEKDDERLDELKRLIKGSPKDVASERAFADWCKKTADSLTSQYAALRDDALIKLFSIKKEQIEARAAADAAADTNFASEPLQGVGSDTWRRLWIAAREYSAAEAYIGRVFPVLNPDPTLAQPRCVLCLQTLEDDAKERMHRFDAFVTGSLAETADKADVAAQRAIHSFRDLPLGPGAGAEAQLQQLDVRDQTLTLEIRTWLETAIKRHDTILKQIDNGKLELESSLLDPPTARLHAIARSSSDHADKLIAAANSHGQIKLEKERLNLTDRRLSADNSELLFKRRDLLKLKGQYDTAISLTDTTWITRKANELVDKHLTAAVQQNFLDECDTFDIRHLHVRLERESGKRQANFQTNPGTTITKLSSDILSEGEQRALALAAFLTETSVVSANGTLIIDDPVSSLDRQRSKSVAERLAVESTKRQIIVFTHDLIFCNELCSEAYRLNMEPHVLHLFHNANGSGNVDPTGLPWKGMPVKVRIAHLREKFASIRCKKNTSPSDYEIEVKNLYSRLREAYERAVEECIFRNVVTRASDDVQTKSLRYVHLTDDLAIRFHREMTNANTHSHDNPSAETVAVPEPNEVDQDITNLETLVSDIRTETKAAEKRRPSMNPETNK